MTEMRKSAKVKTKKKTALIIAILVGGLLITITFLYYYLSGAAHETMQWAKNLSAEDISSIEMVTFPQDLDKQYKLFSNEELESTVALINESRGRYVANPEELCGGAITLYLTMKDGSEHEVSNIGNFYLRIDEDYYTARYSDLAAWPYKEGDEPLPYGFFGTEVPESYVTFQATILEINEYNMFVEPLPGSLELDSADRFSIPIKSMPPSPEAEVGDVIEIQYNGEIMESYPAQLGQIYGIGVITTGQESSF